MCVIPEIDVYRYFYVLFVILQNSYASWNFFNKSELLVDVVIYIIVYQYHCDYNHSHCFNNIVFTL